LFLPATRAAGTPCGLSQTKAVELIRQGVNLLVVDPFPPGPRDPQGIHPLIWDEISDQPFAQPPDKRLTLASYQCAPTKTAYVEPAAVGEPLPEMPLFLRGEWHVPTPLEETYRTAWDVMPLPIKRLFDNEPQPDLSQNGFQSVRTGAE
jgi:hypothetical protein